MATDDCYKYKEPPHKLMNFFHAKTSQIVNAPICLFPKFAACIYRKKT